MSARPQADWRAMEPLYGLSPQHDTARRPTLPKRRERVPPIDAPEMRPAVSPLVSVGRDGKAITIGSAYIPPPATQMSAEAIEVQGWLLPPSKRVRPSVMLPSEWAVVVIGIVGALGLYLGFLR